MGFPALLIHHSGGMIEMHFYIFAFLAMLIVFANPLVIIVAARTIAVHHVSFYFLLPKSVFNYQASFGIVIHHALFVIIETIPAVIFSHSFYKFIVSDQANNVLTTKSINMIETCPINIMMASPDGILTYIHENTKNPLRT